MQRSCCHFSATICTFRTACRARHSLDFGRLPLADDKIRFVSICSQPAYCLCLVLPGSAARHSLACRVRQE